MMLCVVGWGGAVVRGAVAGGGGCEGRAEGRRVPCRQSDRKLSGSVAGTESRKDDAADVAGPQRYAACIGGSWRCERVLAKAGNVMMMLRVVG